MSKNRFDALKTPEAQSFIQAAPTATKPENPAPELGNTANPAYPWESIPENAKGKGLNFPMDGRLHAKMVFITENKPKMSLQKIVKLAVEKWVDEEIEKLTNKQ